MRIGGEDIATPKDSPYAYDTAWRHNVARAMKLGGYSESDPFRDDDIFSYYNYLMLLDDDAAAYTLEDMATGSDKDEHGLFVDMTKAHNIYQGLSGGYYDTTKEKIEALLLCPEMTYASIADYFNVDGDTVRMFEKLYYNVRDEDGLLLGGKGLLETCACIASIGDGDPEILIKDAKHWRLLAFEGGHQALLYEWRWHGKDFNPLQDIDTTASMVRQCYRKFSSIMRSGQNVDQRALASMAASLNEHLAKLQERGILSSKENINKDALLVEFIKMTAPARNVLGLAAQADKQRLLDNKWSDTPSVANKKNDTGSLEYISSQLAKHNR